MQQSLEDRGLHVEIDAKTGGRRRPDDVLVDKSQWELTERGQAAISIVASARVEVLPCYTASDLCEGERSPHLIDAVFVEGHTDSAVMSGGMNIYGLSVRWAE